MTSRSCQLWPVKLCTAIKSLTFNNIKSGQNKNLEKIPDFRWFLNQWHRQFGRKNPSTSNSSRTYDLLVTCPELYHWATGVGDLWELRPLNYCRFMWQTSCILLRLAISIAAHKHILSDFTPSSMKHVCHMNLQQLHL